MIKYNPQYKSDGTENGALTSAPSGSIVFDVPGKAIWVKGVKLLGTDHTYSFDHDTYINLTNTPGTPEDIKIGININTLKAAIDTTYDVVTSTVDGLAPKFNNINSADAAASTSYRFLGLQGSTLKWYTLPHRNIYVENTEVLAVDSTNPLKFVAGTGIQLTWDSTNKRIQIVNSSPDLNHNTDYQVGQYLVSDNADYRLLFKRTANDTEETGSVRYASTILYNPSTKQLKIDGNRVITAADIYVGATSSANATAGLVPAATSAQRNLFLRGDGTWVNISTEMAAANTWRPIKVNSSEKLGSGTDTGAVDFVAGTGITLSWDATNKKITITNSAPDQNHNTDRTGIKLGTISGTKKTDSTVILANSTVGLTIAGGTNKFSIGDGTNYIEVPITISHGLSTKNITINGTAYAIYTSASSLPTFVAPGSYAGTGGYILATNSAKNGLEWVAKPTSNVTTTAIVGNSASATSQITAAQTNPYYNLLEGGAVTRSIRFVAGTGITISAATDGLITITNSAPDVNHDTHYVTTMYIGESNDTKSNVVATNPYLKLFDNNTRRSTLRFVAGNGITIGSDASGNITITNSKPDVNHNTHYTTTMFAGANNDTKANAAATNPYLKLFDNNTRRSTLRFVAGTGITIASDANGNITVTNSAPDVNHNTDRTGLKKGTAGSTAASGLVIANSASGLIMEGGTHKFKVGDGTNSFEIPITVTNLSQTAISALSSFIHTSDLIYAAKGGGNTVTDKPSGVDAFGVISMKTADGWYGLLLMSANTASGVYWRTASSTLSGGWKLIADTGNISNKDATLTTSLTTIATIAGVEIKAKITNYNTDEKVRQVPKTDNTNRPLMMINGGTSQGEQVNTSMFSTGIYANASTKMITASGFIKTGSDSSHVLLGDGGHKALSDFAMANLYVKKAGDTMTGALYINLNSDVSSTGTTGSLIIGNTSSENIGIDGNEIMARNGNTAATLYLLNEGGNLDIRGITDIYKQVTIHSPNFGDQLVLDRTDGVNNAAITFKNTAGILGYLSQAAVNEQFRRYNAAVSTYYWILDSSSTYVNSTGFGYINNVKISTADTLYIPRLTGSLNTDYHDTKFRVNITNSASQTGSPGTQGWLMDYAWDNSSQVCGQIFLGLYNNGLFYRTQTGSSNSWNNWAQVSIVGHTHDDRYYTETESNNKFVYKAGDSMSGTLILKGSTSNVMTYAGNIHPALRFDNSNSSLNVAFIFTDYDSYRSPAGIKLVGNQGGEWFEAPYMYATTFYGNLSGTATNADTLDGYHASGLLTSATLGASGNSTTVSVTVGGTTKTGSVIVPYATVASKIWDPDYHDYSHRRTSANINYADGALHYYLATSTMTTGKPSYDAHILHMAWDNGSWEGQLALPTSGNMQWRTMNGGTWTGWYTILDSNNYTSYCATSGHNHDGRYVLKSGDTMTGQLYINFDQDVGLNKNGSLIIGNKNSKNLAFDGNEIMARNNGAASTLYLNAEGGNVILNSGGGNTGIGTSSPGYKLDVNGNIHGSHIYMGGYLYMSFGGSWLSTIDNDGNGPIFGYALALNNRRVYYTGSPVYICGGSYGNYASGITVNSSNNVGIGTTSPSYKLHVSGDIGTSGNIIISHSASATMTNATTNPRIIFSESGSLAVGLVYTDYDAYRPSKGLKVMDVDGSDPGNVWLEAQGSMYATHFYETSDIRLKHDISMLSKSIRKFRFNNDNKLYYGFIAQELEALHPELVDTSGEHWTVNYNSAICYYIAELENKVQELENKLKMLENRLT